MKVRQSLTPDLLHPNYLDNPKAHCYVASEALYHLLDEKPKVKRMRMGDTVHWWLELDGQVIDLTAAQFDKLPDYSKGVGAGFLTKEPSKRCQIVLDRVAQM